MEFSDMVRGERERLYKTPTEFHRKAELRCTYAAYLDVEKGTVPKINLALEIIRKLGLSEYRALMAWAGSQMPDASSRNVFAIVDAGDDYDDLAHPDGLLLANAQVKLLVEEPLYPKILGYLATRANGDGSRQLAKLMAVEARRMTNLLGFLVDYGLAEKGDDGTYRAKGRFKLPDTAEARLLRARTFADAAKVCLDTKDMRPLRAIVTRRFSAAAIRDVRARIASFLASVDAMPASDDDPVHAVGVFISERTWS